jgi:hypothetical protein
MKFSIQHAKDKPFAHDGLREYFDYRDLGIFDATDGKAVMHVIRASKGSNATGEWHRHELNFQFVYVLKGWAIFEYEGHGQHKRHISATAKSNTRMTLKCLRSCCQASSKLSQCDDRWRT